MHERLTAEPNYVQARYLATGLLVVEKRDEVRGKREGQKYRSYISITFEFE